MATLVEHVRVNRGGVWGALVQLLAISPDGAGPEDILLLGPPDRYGVLLAPAILMPHLGDSLSVLLGCNLRLIIQAFWVVSRPCLKSIGGGISIIICVGRSCAPAVKGVVVLERE